MCDVCDVCVCVYMYVFDLQDEYARLLSTALNALTAKVGNTSQSLSGLVSRTKDLDKIHERLASSPKGCDLEACIGEQATEVNRVQTKLKKSS